MSELVPWVGLAVNLLTVAFFGGIAMQRIKALEARMDNKAGKDDRRDAILAEIRTDVAVIKQGVQAPRGWTIF